MRARKREFIVERVANTFSITNFSKLINEKKKVVVPVVVLASRIVLLLDGCPFCGIHPCHSN